MTNPFEIGNDEVVYVYVHRWEFIDEESKIDFEGHPKEKRVYQAIKNGETYRIPLYSPTRKAGVLVEGSSNESIEAKWKYDLEEINEDNISTLDICKEDVEIITEWEDSDNDNISHLVGMEDLEEVAGGGEPKGSAKEEVKMPFPPHIKSDANQMLPLAMGTAITAYMDTLDIKYLISLIAMARQEIGSAKGLKN